MRHDKARPLHVNMHFKLKRGFKGRFNLEIAREWAAEFARSGHLPRYVEISAVDWQNAKVFDKQAATYKRGTRKDIGSLRKFLTSGRLNIHQIE